MTDISKEERLQFIKDINEGFPLEENPSIGFTDNFDVNAPDDSPLGEEVVESFPSNASTEVLRSIVRTGTDLGKAPIRIPAALVGKEKEAEKFLDLATKQGLESFFQPLALIDPDLKTQAVSSMITDEGKFKENETVAGTISDVGTYILGVKKGTDVVESAIGPFVNVLTKYVLGDAFAGQILKDPEEKENLFNFANEIMPENVTSDMVRYMAGNENDTELVNRLKLFGENAALTTFTELFGNVIKGTSKLYNKTFDDLSSEEKGNLFLNFLEEATEEVKLKREPIEASTVDEVPEDVQQIIDQSNSFFQRTMNRLFSSRGFFTPKAYDLYNISQFNQREIIGKAKGIHKRLQKSLDNITSEVERDRILKISQEVLTEEDISRNAQDIAASFNIPLSAAQELVNARSFIDQLSLQITDSPFVSKETKEIILGNVGNYLRRSYELFENNNYVPTPEVIADAKEYLILNYRKSNKNLTEDEALAKANDTIDTILSKGDKKATYEWITNAKKINKSILTQKNEELAPEIRALMGEIEDPADNILATISKMATFVENSKFYGKLQGLGEGKYIFDVKDPNRDRNVFNVKIPPGTTNSSLDGKYTTQEMLDAILDNQSRFTQIVGDKGSRGGFELYRNFLGLKAAIQKNKTVYSHVTHLRNFTGAIQFGAANGINPFRNVNNSFKTLKEVLGDGTDEETLKFYGRMQELGVINTNVRMGDTQALLDASADTWFARTSEAFIDKTGSKEALQKVEDFYMATDDLFKMNAWATELETLIKANKEAGLDVPLEVLETEAARIIRDTFPNYDRVTPLIKATRDLPLGNFVSFPAEIMRTSYNILERGVKESLSDNPVIKKRGLQRLAGYAATSSGWAGLAKGSEMALGLSEEEAAAIDAATETPWSRSAPRVKALLKDSDGKQYLTALDTQYVNSYSTVQEPFLEVIGAVQRGEVTKDNMDEILKDAFTGAVKNLASPFVSPAILSNTLLDISVATFAEDGRTITGRPLFSPGLQPKEKIFEATSLIFETIAPGSVTSAIDLAKTYSGDRHFSTGKQKHLYGEGIKQVTGFGFRKVSPEDSLDYARRQYEFDVRNSTTGKNSIEYDRAAKKIVERYEYQVSQVYKHQKQFYKKLKQLEPLLEIYVPTEEKRSGVNGEELLNFIEKTKGNKNKTNLREKLELNFINADELLRTKGGSNLSKSVISDIQIGRYNAPKQPTSKLLLENVDKIKFEEGENLATLQAQLDAVYRKYHFLPFDTQELERIEKRRNNLAKGGVVNIPNAPAEPDERINKLTGLPYTETAGPAFQDNEDELDPLRRLGFGGGGRVKKNEGGPEEYDVKKAIESKVASLVGISKENLEWATNLSDKYSGGLDGKGDAARHLGLGFITSLTENPSVALKAANARELIDPIGRKMDVFNNNLGSQIKAKDLKEAEEKIDDLIKNKTAMFMTTEESRQARGY